MSDSLGRHTNKCDLCKGKGSCFQKRKRRYITCPQCKGKGYIVEELDEPIQKKKTIIKISLTWEQWGLLLALMLFLILGGC